LRAERRAFNRRSQASRRKKGGPKAALGAQQALVVLAFGLAIILEFDLGEIGELCEELGVAGARHLRNLKKKAI
jgi:hypothetical protein